jgi:aerobic-type carbon monoxide dehydrogenase small subunit (CoxS/CutS family)
LATQFFVNGEEVEVRSDTSSPLIHVLRNELGFRATRFGCGGEDCGACTVIVDGELRYSCTYLVSDAAGKTIETAEGLKGEVASILRQALMDAGAGQCGYCLSGIFVTTSELMARKSPSLPELKSALSRHLCRCGAHASILRAIQTAMKAVELKRRRT